MYEHRDVPVHPKITNEDTPMRMGWIKTENTNYTQPKKYVGRAKPEGNVVNYISCLNHFG